MATKYVFSYIYRIKGEHVVRYGVSGFEPTDKEADKLKTIKAIKQFIEKDLPKHDTNIEDVLVLQIKPKREAPSSKRKGRSV